MCRRCEPAQPGTRVLTVRNGTCGIPRCSWHERQGPELYSPPRAARGYIRSSSYRATGFGQGKAIFEMQRDPRGCGFAFSSPRSRICHPWPRPGARVDRIAANAGAKQRCCIITSPRRTISTSRCWEDAYEKIRVESAGSIWNILIREGDRALIDFTWNYFIRQPGVLGATEHRKSGAARHLKRSTRQVRCIRPSSR